MTILIKYEMYLVLTRMNFCRSNIMSPKSCCLQGWWLFYRHAMLATLIFALMLAGSAGWGMPAIAADEDWPDAVDYPYLPKPPQPATSPKMKKADINATPAKKKGLWPFTKGEKKPKTDKRPAPTEEQIVKVGPRQTPPSLDPLLRLPLPIRTDSGIIPPGFYLVHLTGGNPDNPTNVMLMKKNKAVFRFALKEAGNLNDENISVTGTSSPIKKIPRGGLGVKAETRLTADQKGLSIIIVTGGRRFESDLFPVASDQRHIIGN
jgi:hypothetical protein